MTTRISALVALALATPLALPAAAPAAQSIATHPRVFLTRDGVDRIRAAVVAKRQPWSAAYDKLVATAGGLLSMRPRAVTDAGKYAGSHDYRSDPPYTTTDGIPDPSVDRADYEAAMAVSHAVRDLGIAYAVTGQTGFAQKALQLIRTWALDPATRMNPRFTNGQSQIELCITMPGLIYGADMIWDYAGWTAADRSGFESWVRALLASAKTWSAAQNYENWRHLLVAAAAAFLDDQASLDYAIAGFKSVLNGQMDASGRMVKELSRTKSLFYSTYAVNAMTQTAEIARVHGVDLWGYVTSSGRGLRKALDYHAPYVVTPSRWPYKQIVAYRNENAALYELAYARWAQPLHYQVIQKVGRPMLEDRVMGPVTLTHADGIQVTTSPTGPTTPAPTYSLLSPDKVIAASPNIDAGHPASHLVDGCITGTPACTTGGPNTGVFYVDFDLGRTYQLTQANLFGDADGQWISSWWLLQYRAGAADAWASAFPIQSAQRSGWVIDTLPGVSARYLRLWVVGAVSGTEARELQVFGQ
jgi:hypothetical protein